MPRLRPGRTLYAACLSLGSLLLLRSLVLQLFWPLAASDRPGAAHRGFCSAQLLYLRQQLAEATWHEGAAVRQSTRGPCDSAAQKAAWQDRLQAVAARCADEPAYAVHVARLSHMEAELCRLTGEVERVWQHDGAALERDLRALAP